MKPIAFFDLETTGTDKMKDRIVEIAIVRLNGDGSKEQFHSLINPEMPIPAAASEVHGITDEKVADAPTLKTILPMITGKMEDADVGGYNSNMFDIPLLYVEMLRCGYTWNLDGVLFIDACNIFKRKEERTLSAAVKFYLDKDHEDAHGALADVLATIDVFKAQRNKYEDVGKLNRQELSLYCNYDNPRADLSGNFAVDANGDYILNFGKHKGKRAKDCTDYLLWMMGQDFMPDTKAIISKIVKP